MQSLLAISDNCFIRRLNENDLQQVLKLQSNSIANLKKGTIHPKSEVEIIQYLNGNSGLVFGIERQSMIIAFSILQIPTVENPNSGLKFKVIDQEDWLHRTCFIENTIVDKNFQGKGFQKLLIDIRISIAINKSMKWVCAGVKFDNIKSWKNLLSKGMVIADFRKDRGYFTLGLTQKINQAPLTFSTEQKIVPLDNETAHQNAISDGFIGVDLIKQNDGTFHLVYKKLLEQNGS